MTTAKQIARDILEALPDECSLEDIAYHLYARAQIEAGLTDLDAGRIVPHEQAMREAAAWLRHQ